MVRAHASAAPLQMPPDQSDGVSATVMMMRSHVRRRNLLGAPHGGPSQVHHCNKGACGVHFECKRRGKRELRAARKAIEMSGL